MESEPWFDPDDAKWDAAMGILSFIIAAVAVGLFLRQFE